VSDFYDEATEPEESGLGPIFTATYESDSSCCGEPIQPGEDIRADGSGGWIHADDVCERTIRVPVPDARASGRLCPLCFCFHAGECS
jgi:hypothetical protein